MLEHPEHSLWIRHWAGGSCTYTAGCITMLHECMQVTIIHVAIQCSQATALCTQAEQYLQYWSRVYIHVGYVHRRLSNTMSTGTIVCRAKAAALLSFDALVLKISLWSSSFLWYGWTFQGERQLLWASYLSVESWSLTTAVKVSKSCHNSRTKP